MLQMQCERILPAATHHSSKGWRKKQQPRFDMSSLAESLCVQTYFTVAVPAAVLRPCFASDVLFFQQRLNWVQLGVQTLLKDVWSSSVFSVLVAGLGAVMSFPLTHKVFALQETGWLTVAIG